MSDSLKVRFTYNLKSAILAYIIGNTLDRYRIWIPYNEEQNGSSISANLLIIDQICIPGVEIEVGTIANFFIIGATKLFK